MKAFGSWMIAAWFVVLMGLEGCTTVGTAAERSGDVAGDAARGAGRVAGDAVDETGEAIQDTAETAEDEFE
ncbi:MAG TPA: hypothetical protein VEB21_16250 [Terriglobales bacterium]|nr:hypothetical protein [Terriglobales bacterium]